LREGSHGTRSFARGRGTAVYAAAVYARPPPESEATFDERWAAWQAKDAAHDGALRRKLALAAPIAVIVLAGIVFALLR
jgi:hypothetical protein